jgi:hypothetical protein
MLPVVPSWPLGRDPPLLAGVAAFVGAAFWVATGAGAYVVAGTTGAGEVNGQTIT